MIVTYHSSLLYPYISHTLDFSLLHHHGHRSSSSLYWIMYYNIALGAKNTSIFIKKKNYPLRRMDIGQVYPNMLSIIRVMGKYMGVSYGDGEGKTRLHLPHCYVWYKPPHIINFIFRLLFTIITSVQSNFVSIFFVKKKNYASIFLFVPVKIIIHCY